MKSPFEKAKEFSACASKLDDMDKTSFSPDLLKRVVSCVEQMHDLAIELAGDRVDEIYCPDDNPSESIPCVPMKFEVLEEIVTS